MTRENAIRWAPLLVLIGLVILFTAINPAFLSQRNFARIAIAAAPALMVAIGVTFIIVMGSIYTGIATTTEAAALGAAGALLLTIHRVDMRIKGLNQVLMRTAQTTTMLMMLIVFGSFFGFVVSRLGIAHGMVEAVLAANLDPWMVLAFYIGGLLLLGCVMDPASMMVITLPLAFPVLQQLGFDPIWLGVLVTIAVEIGMITPPVGLNLFVLKGIVSDDITMTDIMMGAAPFVVIMMIGLLAIILFPPIATFLPSMMAK